MPIEVSPTFKQKDGEEPMTPTFALYKQNTADRCKETGISPDTSGKKFFTDKPDPRKHSSNLLVTSYNF